MAQWFVLYSKEGCRLCTKTKELLQIMGADYYEEILPSDDEWKTPVVFLEDNYIGGYKSLQLHFKRQVVSKRNKNKNVKKKEERNSV